MVTVISHFYNEEYLLPFWINHHIKLFDHGILIDHGSTDNSRKIIHELAPSWEIYESELSEFDAVLTDFEVQIQEKKVKGWKIVLNTTEFLVGDLKEFLKNNSHLGRAYYLDCKIMVDLNPEVIPSLNKSLVVQKSFGINDNRLYHFFIRRSSMGALYSIIFKKSRHSGRQRLIHNYPIGGYSPGRHMWPYHTERANGLLIFWYAFSPWNELFIKRKLSIKDKLPLENVHLGYHHRKSFFDLKKSYSKHKYFLKVLRFFRLN